MVKFETVLNKKSSETINKIAIKKLTPFCIALSILLISLGFFELFGEEADIFIGIFFIVMGALFYPLTLILFKVFQKKSDNSMPILSDETTVNFTFYFDKVVVEEKRFDDFSSYTEMAYKYYHKVVETPTHYLLYLSKGLCHVVPKADLKEGALEELNSIFIKQLGPEKFVLKKK